MSVLKSIGGDIDKSEVERIVKGCFTRTVEFTIQNFQKRKSKIDIYSASYSKNLLRGYVSLLSFCNRQGSRPEGMMAVDLGVGKGWSTWILSRFFKRAVGYDLERTVSEQMEIDRGKWQADYWDYFGCGIENLGYEFFDGYHIPQPRESADLVFAHAVIEHIDDNALDNAKRKLWLKEIHRILKVGGLFYVSGCPNYYSYAEKLTDWLHISNHEKRFKGGELISLLEESGFRVRQFDYTHPYIDFYPGRLQDVWNFLYRLFFQHVEIGLCMTPLKYLAHHFRLIAVKT